VSEEGLRKRLREDGGLREELRERLDRWLDVPLALASIVLVLLALIELGGELAEPWRGRVAVLGWALWGLFFAEFAVKLALAPSKRAYLKRHPLDVLTLLLPFLRFLRLLRVLRVTRALPVVRLLIFGGRGSGAALALLGRRRLGQLALVSLMVVLLGAALGYVLEVGAPGAAISGFGDALWWSAALMTTVGSELYPVTPGGRILGFVLALYAVGVFSYFIASIASVFVDLDARKKEADAKGSIGQTPLDERDLEALRRILAKAEGPPKGS